eukprot:scaffold26963_cov84-Amphora_coffeaeformis.AAC.1
MTQLELYRPKNVTAVEVVQNETTASVHTAQNTMKLNNETGVVSLKENVTIIEEPATASENTNISAKEKANASNN